MVSAQGQKEPQRRTEVAALFGRKVEPGARARSARAGNTTQGARDALDRVKARWLDIKGMPPRMRWLFWSAIASSLVIQMLYVVRFRVPGPALEITGKLFPVASLFLTTAFVAIAQTCFTVTALYLPSYVRWSVWILVATLVFPPLPRDIIGWLAVGCVALALVGILWPIERRALAQERDLDREVYQEDASPSGEPALRIVLAILLILLGYYVARWWGSVAFDGGATFVSMLQSQLQWEAYLLIGLLVLVGRAFLDIVEACVDAATARTRAARSAARVRLLAGVTLCVTVAITCGIVAIERQSVLAWLSALPFMAIFTVVLTAGVALIARLGRVGTGERLAVTSVVPAGAVACASLAAFFALVFGDHVFPDRFAVYRSVEPTPTFSMAYPSDWTPRESLQESPGRGLEVSFTKGSGDGAATMIVCVYTLPTPPTGGPILDPRISDCLPRTTRVSVHDPTPHTWFLYYHDVYYQGALAGLSTAFVAEAYYRVEGIRVWVVRTVAPAAQWEQTRDLSDRALASWRPDGYAEVPESGLESIANPSVLLRTLALLGLAAGGIWMLVRSARTGRTGWLGAPAALFFGVLGVFTVCYSLPALAWAVGIPAELVPVLTLPDLLLITSAVTIVALVCLLLIRRLRDAAIPMLDALLVLNVGLFAIWVINELFRLGSTASTGFPPAAVVLVVVSVVWTCAVSGDYLNPESHRLSQNARLFTGIGLAALFTAVIAFSGLQYSPATGAQVSVPTIGAAWSQLSLILIGVPIVVTECVLRWGHPTHVPFDDARSRRGSDLDRVDRSEIPSLASILLGVAVLGLLFFIGLQASDRR